MASGGPRARLLRRSCSKLAGFADVNRFGLYDPLNSANKLEVFAGGIGPGASASLAFETITGGTRITVNIEGASVPERSAVFSSEVFGFLLSTPQGNSFFSQSNLNAGGADHSYAYRGDGSWFLTGRRAGYAVRC